MTTAGWPSIVAVLREQLGSMRNIPRPPVAYPAGTIGNRGRPLSASLAEHGRCLRDALSWLGSRCRPLSATACAAACCWGVSKRSAYTMWHSYLNFAYIRGFIRSRQNSADAADADKSKKSMWVTSPPSLTRDLKVLAVISISTRRSVDVCGFFSVRWRATAPR